MDEIYVEDKLFSKITFRENKLLTGEYFNCRFEQCDFSETDFSDMQFAECEFVDCNISLVKLNNTAFRNLKFIGSKMIGLRFDECNPFGLSFFFDNCILNYSSFYGTKIKNTIFKNSQLQEVDFSESDLTKSIFDNCDLSRTRFENTFIEKSDFRTALNYSIDPEINRIKNAKFSISGLPGLLEKYDIKIDLSN